MPKKRDRQRVRGTSPHPGVALLQWERGGKTVHVARLTDPVTGKRQIVSMDAIGLTNDMGRRDWALRKSKEIQAIKAKMKAPVGPEAPEIKPLADEVQGFIGRIGVKRSKRTVGVYQEALALFQAWAIEKGIQDLRQLAPHLLPMFIDWVASRPRQRSRKGGGVGGHEESEGQLAPRTVNIRTAAVWVFLTDCRRRGVLPHITLEDLTLAKEILPEERPLPSFLQTPEIRDILEAALRHDDATFEMTKEEHDGLKPKGTTPRHPPVAPSILGALLSGCRAGELFGLEWSGVHLAPPNGGNLTVNPTASKTRRARIVDLSCSPSLVRLLSALRIKSGGEGPVFGLTNDEGDNARKRMIRAFGSPPFTWQQLRQTCASYLTNAPGIFGGASAYRSAQRLGHGVQVAERHYVGLVRDIPKDAETLEAAMGIEDIIDRIIERVGAVQVREVKRG